MIEELKPYADYKESGLDWLGQIPVSWETPRTKTRFRLSMEKSGLNHGKELLSVYTHIGVRPRKDLEARGNKASSTDDYWVVRQGDIIVNKLLAWMGAVGVSKFDGVTSPAYDILRPIQKLEPDFYHLLFRTKLYLQLFKSRSRGIMDMRLRLYFDQLGQIPLICPPSDEQAAIVRFLDHANRKIDVFIQAKRKLIGLLNEQKQAIIHRAVTRGLHPDVPLKPSGIPWLGDIPKHWEVVRSRSMFRLFGGYAFPGTGFFRYESDATLPLLLTPVNFDPNGGLRFNSKSTVRFRGSVPDQFQLRTGDLVTVLTDLSSKRLILGRAGFIEHDGVLLNQRTARVDIHANARTKLSAQFLCWVLNSSAVREQTIATSRGSTVFHTSPTRMLAARWPLPPVTEQTEIMGYLDHALKIPNSAIARTEREIALMQEYRTRLTADLVTGKLDVREAAAKLPEVPAAAEAESTPDEPLEEIETKDDPIEEV
jgi:type I restriction enzyme, S subunit